mmetsp:Transcript_1357/g.4048  ORF Transcript_1357/g.4048 Transcript_1357/m.4048 type:complete len:577 (-) Transcript_1357:297-2027(-)|eukprot:CAMPEP_0206146346 /NCGR_PEP_ID=MMETSP1473-20131121/30081_1 /ASSEMBLY_ACC=CAM_ASM_001109 /TAXON_ID=1461547 /ORGANISM="Stichococcus sp, Strain RCC1054" /LENGTH=576 /DNA_ID=CAMNT_0053542861 /DNA_START=182 /DNA_END=1912 /DNA_ORIENTATION=-
MGFSLAVTWQSVLFAIAVALFIYGWRPVQRWKYRHIPGPPPVWLIGNLPGLLRMDRPVALQQWAKEYGPIFKIFQGGTLVVVVADAAAARTVNMRNHSRPPFLTILAGEQAQRDKLGLLFADNGPYWQSMRQAWQAMFHPDSLRGYIGFINQSADHLVEALAPAAQSGSEVEVWRVMGQLTVEVVGSAAFGLPLDAFDSTREPIPADSKQIEFDDNDQLHVAVQKVAAVLFGFSGFKDSLYPLFVVLFPELKPILGRMAANMPDKAFKRILDARRRMRDICLQLISKARADIKSGSEPGAAITGHTASANGHVNGSTNGHEAGTANGHAAGQEAAVPPARGRSKRSALPPGGFVHHMLKADNRLMGGRPFTDEEIASQINTFMLAGYETTASALAFTVYHLANTPAAESKLIQEVDAFGGRDAVPSYDDLNSKFPYLTACIDESLRVSAPGAFGTVRLNREDTTLCGFHIAKGTYFNTAQYTYQHSAQYWDDPDTFCPERLLTGPGTSSPAWAAFGDGGRQCVGLKLAYAEAKITLIRLYQYYTFRLTPGQVPLATKTTITYQPKNGVHVTVHPRP